MTIRTKKKRKRKDISIRACRRALRNDPAEIAETVRSRVTNREMRGMVVVPGVDMREPWARRLRDLVQGAVADLGGLDNLSNIERALVSRASWLLLQLEQIETLVGKERDGVASPRQLREYGGALSNLRRVLDSLHRDGGYQRRAREAVTPVTHHELTEMLDA
jgi:hypothetical protein